MIEKPITKIGPKTSLFSALLTHCCVEIPFFIFPVILLLVGADLFPVGELSWIGLGALGTTGTLAAGLPSPFFGKLADKYRCSTLMFVSVILAAFGAFLIGLFGETFVAMLSGVIFMGLSLALYHPAGLSWISKIFEKPGTHSYSSNYVRILALHGIGGSLGASIGPLSVYFLFNMIDWREIYLFWSIPLTFFAILFWILVGRHESHPESSISSMYQEVVPTKNSIKSKFSNWRQYSVIMLIFVFITIMSLTRGMVNFILSPFLSEVKNIEIATAALFIGLSTLIGSAGQFLGGFFGDKYGEKVVLQFSAILQVFTLIGIFIIDIREVIFLLYVLMGVITALFWPASNSLVAKNSTERGRAFGWVMLVANFVGALGPSIDGLLLVITPNQYILIFYFACFFSFCGFISLLFLRSSNNEIQN